MKTNSDSCGSRAAYGYPPKQASAAYSRSAECFCQRLQHSHFTPLEVIVLRLASAKPDRVCGAGMRRSGAEGRSPEAIAKRYARTRARASIIGVYQPFLLPYLELGLPRAEAARGFSLYAVRGGQGRDSPARRSRPFGGARFLCGGHGAASPRKATLSYHSRRGTDKSGNESEKKTTCVSFSYGPTSADCAILLPAMSKQFNLRLSLELRGCRSAERACV